MFFYFSVSELVPVEDVYNCSLSHSRLDVLIQMALCGDEATQEHAVEAIAELITVPVIQVGCFM